MDNKLKVVYTCFPKGKSKVLTMSYDDGMHEDRRLVGIFDKYGIRGTFHLNSGIQDESRIPSGEWKDLYKNHEVSCHTVHHPFIGNMPIDQVALQVLEDRRNLERIMGYPVRGMSYPYGSYTKEIVELLPKLGIEYCRTVHSTNYFGMPDDFLTWPATCHHDGNLLENGKKFLEIQSPERLSMMYVWGHSFEFERNNNWELIEEFCQMMGGHDDIWYATNIEIVDYVKAINNLKFTIDADMVYNPSAQSVWIRVDDKVIEVPGGATVKF